MVVEAASQLGLFQIRSDVFVGHLLETGLEKIDFLCELVKVQLPESIVIPHLRSKLCLLPWTISGSC